MAAKKDLSAQRQLQTYSLMHAFSVTEERSGLNLYTLQSRNNRLYELHLEPRCRDDTVHANYCMNNAHMQDLLQPEINSSGIT